MSRKLVSVQRVLGIEPIPWADRIEIARVLGWKVVVNKNMSLKPGDLVAYFETDSFLPAEDPRYADFMKGGVKTVLIEDEHGQSHEMRGMVLRTRKIKGVYSQGLIMSLDSLGIHEPLPEGTDITRLANVIKYEEPIPVGKSDIIGPFNTDLCCKSDAPRVQLLVDVWDQIVSLSWTATIKVDGTSTTITRDMENQLHVYSRNWELAADAPGMTIAEEAGLTQALEPGMAVQYELCGPNINSNRLRLARLKPFVFAVWQNGRQLDRTDWPTAMRNHAVPVLEGDEWKPRATVEETVNLADGLRGHVTRDILDEGIVWHLNAGQQVSGDVLEVLDQNLCFKAINNSYLVKHGL